MTATDRTVKSRAAQDDSLPLRALPSVQGDAHAAPSLEQDIELLLGMLERSVAKFEGERAVELVDEVRSATRALRSGADPGDQPLVAERLLTQLAKLSLSSLRTLTRFFSLSFDLINLAEQQARIRALRLRTQNESDEPQSESPQQALALLRAQGVSADALAGMLDRLRIRPVFTAHPSEARRRTVLEKLDQIAAEMERIETQALLPRERRRSMHSIVSEIETFWLTDIVRRHRPSPVDEVRHGLGMVSPSLFEIAAEFYQSFEEALTEIYPERTWDVPSLLTFGSWIGGDRDGNPHVTPEVTRSAVKLHREIVLERYLDRVRQLGRKLSQSRELQPVRLRLLASLERDFAELPDLRRREPASSSATELYRTKLRAIEMRLSATRGRPSDAARPGADFQHSTSAIVYRDPHDLLEDLSVIVHDLQHSGSEHAVVRDVRALMREVDVFGFHFLTLDIRQHAGRHGEALAEIFAWAGLCSNYLERSPNERFDLLVAELEVRRPLVPADPPFSESTCELLETFHTVAQLLESSGERAIERYIISGATDPAHILEVLVLARETGLFDPRRGVSRLDIVPLFESHAALQEAVPVLQRLISLPLYQRQLELRHRVQEIMLGYSDSSKESGPLHSAWAIYKAQRELDALSRRAGFTLQVFHGRGGAIGRGGGPANRAILAQPSPNGRIAITEQGEVIADRYNRPIIAWRHLEQILHAMLATTQLPSAQAPATHPPSGDPPPTHPLSTHSPSTHPLSTHPEWEWAVERLALAAREHYRELVYDCPDFIAYFEQATPYFEIGALKLASRPARRATGGGIENLRAIPWVFSWMQSRHTLPGWYGFGSAFSEVCEEHPELLEQLRVMYAHWPFWRTVVDNTAMILAKADLTIARLYARLTRDRELGDTVFRRIEIEFQRTRDAVCHISEQGGLLDRMPILKQSIERRIPYIDPLSFVQIVLLGRLREGQEPQDELLVACLESIAGIASALKNTG